MKNDLVIWKNMIDLWNTQEVPQVEIRPFADKMGFSHWNSKVGHYTCDTNPLRTTAYHLAVHLNECSADLVATYKIFAFCFHYDILHKHSRVLAAGFGYLGTVMRGWWSQNSKNVLPFAPAASLPPKEDLAQWDRVVVAAAKEWEAIADEWVVVRVPDLMLRNSTEKLAWEDFLNQRHLECERREYERLKLKFA